MNKVLFESEIYGKEKDIKMFPFQIYVKESFENGRRTVETIRREFKPVSAGRMTYTDSILSASTWKEEE